MAGPQRVERLREEIKREVSDILRKMKDPRIGFVTVTDVDVSRDLQHVKIFVSIYGDEEAKSKTLTALERATGFVRTEIGRRIRLRHTPEISFRFDPSIERGAHVLKLLQEVRATAPPEPDPPGEEAPKSETGGSAAVPGQSTSPEGAGIS